MLDPETAEAVWLEKQPSFLERLFSSATGSGEVAVAPRDLFSRFAAKPEWMLARAVHDARQILTGSAIQARCLECPSTAMPLAPREKATLGRSAEHTSELQSLMRNSYAVFCLQKTRRNEPHNNKNG